MSPSLSPPAAPVAPDLVAAAGRYFPDLTAMTDIPGHPALARVDAPAGSYLVRRWPEGVPLSNIAFSQLAMGAAREAGLPAPIVVGAPTEPREPALRHDGRLFTAQTWLPGATPPRAEVAWPGPDTRIDLPGALPAALFAAVVTAMARLHESPAGNRAQGAPQAPLGMLPGAVRQAHERHLGALRARAPREPAIQRWLATSERLAGRAEPLVLEAAQDRDEHPALLHLGLWPAHVLVADGSLAGLLGWERAALGSPLLDLAQAVLRLQGWRDETVELAVGAYGEARSLSPDERRLLPAVAALDAVATTGRLLEQTYAVTRVGRPPAPLRAAIDMMLQSLSTIESDLTAQASAGKKRRSPWRHAAPVAPRRKHEGERPHVRRRRSP